MKRTRTCRAARSAFAFIPAKSWPTNCTISPTELARQLAVPPNRITQIIQGKRSITGDTALRLAHWFGTDPQFWLNLQSSYEIDVAVEQAGAEIKKLPTRAMAAA